MFSYEIWDVFTSSPYCGNPLAIVPDAQGLTKDQMLKITRQFNLSETVFLFQSDVPSEEARLRIFYPGGEMPFAGHPTVGAAHWIAANRNVRSMILREKAGPVSVLVQDGLARFAAPVLPEPVETKLMASRIAAALGLEEEALGPDAPAIHQGGPHFLYVEVRGLDALAAARPIQPAFDQVLAKAGGGLESMYVYTRTGPESLRTRMFAPSGGIPEDPATGSAAAILASQLQVGGHLSDGSTRLRILQGVEMGRPSKIGLRIVRSDGQLQRVEVEGRAVPVASGRMRRPT